MPVCLGQQDIIPQDSRARQAGGFLNFELRIAPFSHVSRFTRHSLWPLADFFSILLNRLRSFVVIIG